MRDTHRHRVVTGASLGGLVLAAALGCASITARAPRVSADLVAAAAVRGVEPAALERGRALYVGRCTRCHGLRFA